MDLNFTVSLTDIGIGLELSGDSESERQEVMDFLVHVDESVADADFTHDLIYRLVLSIAEDSEVRGWKPVALPEGRATTFSQLYETLSHMPEDELIALVANAMMVKREREAEAAERVAVEAVRRIEELEKEAAKFCAICGHTLKYHDSLKRLSACTLTSIKDEAGSIPCPCEGFEEKQ